MRVHRTKIRWLVVPFLYFAILFSACQEVPEKPGKKEVTREEMKAPRKLRTCEAKFVSKRQGASWYPAHDFGDAVACDQPKSKLVEEKVSIPIYWAIAGKNWTEADVKEKFDAAKPWFDKYCVSLTVYPVVLKTGESDNAANALATADSAGRDPYRAKINDVYRNLWENRMGKPREFILVLFVDPFQQVKYDNVWVNVSGNLSDIPVIMITSADKTSKHILTHELIHGLGKGIGTGTPPGATRSDGDAIDNTWNEGGCSEEMGNAARTAPSTPMNKADDAPMDWASYWHYTRASHGIR